MSEIKLDELKLKVAPENIPSWRTAIAVAREKKGMEAVAISLTRALRESVKELNFHGDVINLYWEEALCGQHVVMNEHSKPESEQDGSLIVWGLNIMEEATKDAHEYIEEKGVKEMLPKSYRFMGRVNDYNKDYSQAIANYEKSIVLFSEEEDLLVKVNALEVKGFLAFSLIMSGDIRVGKQLAEDTYHAFFASEEGRELKKADYFTWAVWTSGIPFRVINALIDRGESIDKEWAEGWAKQAEELLVIPEDDETWGDKDFGYRRDEAASLNRRLASL